MDLADRYEWEAECADGEVITSGDRLHGCRRFTLKPKAPGLKRVDIVGVPLRRRFCRGFVKTRLNQQKDLPGLFFWENGSPEIRTSGDVSNCLAPGDFIGKGVAGDEWYPVLRVEPDRVTLCRPYAGISKPRGFRARKLLGAFAAKKFYFHCIETDAARIWVDYRDGNVLITPRNYEHYV